MSHQHMGLGCGLLSISAVAESFTGKLIGIVFNTEMLFSIFRYQSVRFFEYLTASEAAKRKDDLYR